jgi:hypothetical protein
MCILLRQDEETKSEGGRIIYSYKLETIHERGKVFYTVLYLYLMGNKYNSFVFQSLKDAFDKNMSTNSSINSTEWIIKQVDISVNKQKATFYTEVQDAANGRHSYVTEFCLPLYVPHKKSKISNVFLL